MRSAMASSGLSQADLARACNVSGPTVSNWLSRIKKSKRMQVESSFYQQGSHVFTFQTEGLNFADGK